jgi:hypothetical protein
VALAGVGAGLLLAQGGNAAETPTPRVAADRKENPLVVKDATLEEADPAGKTVTVTLRKRAATEEERARVKEALERQEALLKEVKVAEEMARPVAAIPFLGRQRLHRALPLAGVPGPGGCTGPLAGVPGPDVGFQQVVQVAFDPLAQHEAVVAGEPAGVMARPQDEVVGLRDDGEFLAVVHPCTPMESCPRAISKEQLRQKKCINRLLKIARLRRERVKP